MPKSYIAVAASLCVIGALLWGTLEKKGSPMNCEYISQRVLMDSSCAVDAKMEACIQVYRDSIASKMGEFLCYSDAIFTSRRPESNIMRLISDALLAESRLFAKENKLPTPDFALFNVGGIRDDLPMGPITVLHVFQVSPFENYAVLVEADSATVVSIMEHIAERGGEALAGAAFDLQMGQAKNITINGKPLSGDKTYHVATLDYIAEGGDSFFCMTGLKRYDTSILFREMLTNYFRKMGQMEQHLKPSDVERIRHN